MNVHEIEVPTLVEERNLILMPYENKWADIVPPNSKIVVLQNRVMYACPNTPDFNAVLYNIGHPVASPIYFSDYDWGSIQIFAAQAEMAGLMVARRRAYNLSALGCGKTIGSLLAIDWLIVNGYVEHALIIAPLSILWNVWRDEIMKRMARLRPIILHGPAEKRRKLLKQPNWSVAIINHDGITVMLEELIAKRFGVIIVDEASQFRDVRTKKHKALAQLLHPAPFAAALTGSPTPNYPSDAYGLARLFTPERVKMSFRNFRATVETEIAPHRYLPKPDAAEKVNRILQPAVRFRRQDIVELAGCTSASYKVELSPLQLEAFKAMRTQAMARFPEGDVTAANAAILVNKLLQICSGAVYTKDRQIVDLKPVHRIEMTRELMAQAEGKVIVLVPYLHITELLKAEFPNAEVVNGSVKPKDRAEIFRSFQDPRDRLREIIAHPKVLAHGLNLTQANVIIWFGPIYSRELYEQANGRIIRLGQEREQLIAHLTGSPVEAEVYRMLEKRGDMQDIILSLFENDGETTDNQLSVMKGKKQALIEDDEFSIA